MAGRAVIVGEAPRIGGDPSRPLAGLTENSSGARLRKMAGISEPYWLESVRRVNLVSRLGDDGRWPRQLARDNALNLAASLLRDENLVLCGRNVARAFGLRPEEYEWAEWTKSPLGPTVAVIPHPSGRCLHYNDPEFRRKVGDFLRRNL